MFQHCRLCFKSVLEWKNGCMSLHRYDRIKSQHFKWGIKLQKFNLIFCFWSCFFNLLVWILALWSLNYCFSFFYTILSPFSTIEKKIICCNSLFPELQFNRVKSIFKFFYFIFVLLQGVILRVVPHLASSLQMLWRRRQESKTTAACRMCSTQRWGGSAWLSVVAESPITWP